jgi:hypothetical protein
VLLGTLGIATSNGSRTQRAVSVIALALPTQAPTITAIAEAFAISLGLACIRSAHLFLFQRKRLAPRQVGTGRNDDGRPSPLERFPDLAQALTDVAYFRGIAHPIERAAP